MDIAFSQFSNKESEAQSTKLSTLFSKCRVVPSPCLHALFKDVSTHNSYVETIFQSCQCLRNFTFPLALSFQWPTLCLSPPPTPMKLLFQKLSSVIISHCQHLQYTFFLPVLQITASFPCSSGLNFKEMFPNVSEGFNHWTCQLLVFFPCVIF